MSVFVLYFVEACLNPRLENTALIQHCSVLAARRLRSRNAAALRLPSVCLARNARNAAWMLAAAALCRLHWK